MIIIQGVPQLRELARGEERLGGAAIIMIMCVIIIIIIIIIVIISSSSISISISISISTSIISGEERLGGRSHKD